MMQSCCGSTFHQENGYENAASPDLELVAAVRAGSSAAFEELRSRYSRRLYWRIQAMTRNHEDTEDALQDTFLHAYLALDSFEGRSQFGSWLTRIAINSALMVLRRRRRRAEVSFEPPLESGEPGPVIDVPDLALNPEQLYDVRQRSRSALRAVSKLKINLRVPMTTWIEKECSMKEVARTLDLSLATVKARFHRARKQISRSAAAHERISERISNAGSISGSTRQYLVPGFENRGHDGSVQASS
jgi:RNA polymerase sigma-70 factor (ECF subfamily)